MKHNKTNGASLLACTLAGLAMITAATAQPSYTVTDLGTLSGGGSSTAYGLNDLGDVVGSCGPDIYSSDTTGFVWRNGVMTSTGRLPKGFYSYANAINSSGVVVGVGDTGNGRPQSWVSTASGLYNFFPNNGGNTYTVGINDAGAICGNYTKSLSGWVASWKAAIWTPDPKDPRKYRTTDLPVIPGIDPKSTQVFTTAFNQAGQVVGSASNDLMGQHACLWNNNAAHSIVDLGMFPGDWSSVAYGINDFGQIAGESHPAFGTRPVVWNNDAAHTPSELPQLPGDNSGQASRINNLGHVIGSSYHSDPGTWDNATLPRLVVWRDGGVFELQSVLDATTGAGWTLTSATAINNLGQIVGSGMHNGQARAFLLTPMAQ